MAGVEADHASQPGVVGNIVRVGETVEDDHDEPEDESRSGVGSRDDTRDNEEEGDQILRNDHFTPEGCCSSL